MAGTKKVKAVERVIKRIKLPEGKQCVYANHFQVNKTPFDLRLVFGEITDISEQAIEVTERVQVTMSLPFAKVVLQLLTAHIQDSEDANAVKIEGAAFGK